MVLCEKRSLYHKRQPCGGRAVDSASWPAILAFSFLLHVAFPTPPLYTHFSLFTSAPFSFYHISWRNIFNFINNMPSQIVSIVASTVTKAKIDDAALVYHLNILLLSIAGLFFIVRLPGTIALFGTASEWFDGHFLHYTPYRPSPRMAQVDYGPQNSKMENASSDHSHTLYSHAPHAQRVTAKGVPVQMRFPPHIASCFNFLHPILNILRLRISPGFSMAQSSILFIYFLCLVYASFYRSNVFTDPSRTGWIAISQLPIVFALSQKNNVLGSLLGYGYEKVFITHVQDEYHLS